MYYGINYYAPKISNIELSNSPNSHAIGYSKCNFNCKFCKNKNVSQKEDFEFYKGIVDAIIPKGVNFKFTGGEPTIFKDIKKYIAYAKSYGGKIFLDTNGSRPEIVKDLIESNLIDVLGISLKGLTKEQSMETACITNSTLCYDNVLETIRYASNHSKVRVIITYVIYNEHPIEEIEKFANLISQFPNVFLKINNLMIKNDMDASIYKLDGVKEAVEQFAISHKEWQNRIIYINDYEGVSNYEKIEFF